MSSEDAKPAAPAAPQPSVGQKAKRGSKWAVLGFGFGQVLRLASNLVLTRLIAREAFGIFLIVRFVLVAVNQFSDVGVGASIVQNRRDDPKFVNTAWVMQIARGVIMSAVAAALAWPAAIFYGQPLLLTLVPIAGSVGLITGLNSTKLFTANRNLNIKYVTLVEFGAQLFGATLTISWALVSPTVWALAAGAMGAAFAKMLLTHTILPGGNNRIMWDKQAARELFGFGKWVFLSTLLAFLATQADRAVFGRLFDPSLLGVYAIAVLLAFTPQQVFRKLSLWILFPMYSHIVRDGGDLATVFAKGRRRILVVAGPVCALLLGGGPSIVAFLYEDSYKAAGWMVQILAMGTWFNALEVTDEAATLARGKSRTVAAASATKLLLMSGTIVAGYLSAGVVGAIAGFAFAEAFRWLYLARDSARAGLGGVGQALGFTGMLLLSGAAAYASAWGVRELGLGAFVQCIAVGLTVVACWLPLALPELRLLRR